MRRAHVGSGVSERGRICSVTKVSLAGFSHRLPYQLSLVLAAAATPPLRKTSLLRSHADDLQSKNFPICCVSLGATQTDCPGVSGATNRTFAHCRRSSARHGYSQLSTAAVAKPHVQFPLVLMRLFHSCRSTVDIASSAFRPT